MDMKFKDDYTVEVINAAYDAVDQNDGNHWQILEAAKPQKMEISEFIERLLDCYDEN